LKQIDNILAGYESFMACGLRACPTGAGSRLNWLAQRLKLGQRCDLRVHFPSIGKPMLPHKAPFIEPDHQFCGLLEAVAAGDRVAFRTLYDKALPILFGICVRLLRDRELAQDMLQEAMLRIW
jgi:hypothetical protein